MGTDAVAEAPILGQGRLGCPLPFTIGSETPCAWPRCRVRRSRRTPRPPRGEQGDVLRQHARSNSAPTRWPRAPDFDRRPGGGPLTFASRRPSISVRTVRTLGTAPRSRLRYLPSVRVARPKAVSPAARPSPCISRSPAPCTRGLPPVSLRVSPPRRGSSGRSSKPRSAALAASRSSSAPYGGSRVFT